MSRPVFIWRIYMEYNLVLNGEYTYPLISPDVFRAEGDCQLIIGAEDFAEIK